MSLFIKANQIVKERDSKTAMNNLIDYVKEMQRDGDTNLQHVLNFAEKALEYEERQIIEAHSEGMKTVDCRPEYSQIYFDERFKK
jgi:hypothetical protein